MNVPHMIAQMLSTLERITIATIASVHSAWEVTLAVSLHMALEFILSIEELVGSAAWNAAFEDLGWLAARWDRCDVGA